MPIEYCFFRHSAGGIVDSAERLRFVDDAAALAHAQALRAAARIEVWAGKRRVGVVPPALSGAGGA